MTIWRKLLIVIDHLSIKQTELMLFKNQDLHPLIKYMKNWQAFNIKSRKSLRDQWIQAVMMVAGFLLLACFWLG